MFQQHPQFQRALVVERHERLRREVQRQRHYRPVRRNRDHDQ